MTDLRTAAQQALEALLKSHTCPLLPDDCEAAITALKAALAQQAEPVEAAARIRTWHKDGEQHAELRVWEDGIEGLPDGEHLLYTAPPQRKPLTEEMEARCPYAKANPTLRGAFFDGWLNSERAHGITDPATPACPDCHGVGYDASGQTCACQENPSF